VEDHNGSALPDGLSGLAAVVGHIHSLFAHDLTLAWQAAVAREAFGDGEMLRFLFRNLFPARRPMPHLNPDGSPILSAREVDVLKEAAKDLGHDEIAKRLNITPRTVDTHLAHVYRKLHVQRPMQAVARAIYLGYLSSPFEFRLHLPFAHGQRPGRR
jgi:DNA-binding CsgD family transcriptional regulator